VKIRLRLQEEFQRFLHRLGYTMRPISGTPREYFDPKKALESQGGRRLAWPLDDITRALSGVAMGDDAEFKPGRFLGTDPARTLIVDILKIRSYDAFSYAPDGWHPLVHAVREDISRGRREYSGSALEAFLASYQPENQREVFLEAHPDAKDRLLLLPPAMGLVPWIHSDSTPKAGPGGVANFGPTCPREGQLHMSRLHGAYESFKTYGYLPQAFSGGYVRGYLIVKHGDYRFIVQGGHHRMAALSVLADDEGSSGYIEVAFDPTLPPVIHIDDANRWPGVVSGDISNHWARTIVERYFEENGWEKASNLGVL